MSDPVKRSQRRCVCGGRAIRNLAGRYTGPDFAIIRGAGENRICSDDRILTDPKGAAASKDLRTRTQDDPVINNDFLETLLLQRETDSAAPYGDLVINRHVVTDTSVRPNHDSLAPMVDDQARSDLHLRRNLDPVYGQKLRSESSDNWSSLQEDEPLNFTHGGRHSEPRVQDMILTRCVSGSRLATSKHSLFAAAQCQLSSHERFMMGDRCILGQTFMTIGQT